MTSPDQPSQKPNSTAHAPVGYEYRRKVHPMKNSLFVLPVFLMLCLLGCDQAKKAPKEKKSAKQSRAQQRATSWSKRWHEKIKRAKWKLGKVQHARLSAVALHMKRKKVRKLLDQVRKGRWSDFDWTQRGARFTAYFLRQYEAVAVRFDRKDRVEAAYFIRCKKPSVGSLKELRTELGTLYPHVEKIHQSPAIRGWDFDPLALVRSVNYLRTQGKTTALNAMRAYLRLLNNHIACRHRYGFDERRLLLLTSLLFAHKNTKPAPALALGHYDVRLPKSQRSKWPHFPLALVKDLPFLLVTGIDRTKKTTLLPTLLNHYQRHGTLRDKPLTPRISPTNAIQTLTQSPRWKALFTSKAQNISRKIGVDVTNQHLSLWQRFKRIFSKKGHKKLRIQIKTVHVRKVKFPQFTDFHRFLLRWQAMRASSYKAAFKKKLSPFQQVSTDSRWQRIRNGINRQKLRWNANTQRWRRDG